MKFDVNLLFIGLLLFNINCKKSIDQSLDDSKNNNQNVSDSVFSYNLTTSEKKTQDSLSEIRKSANLKLLEYENIDKIFAHKTINISIVDIENFLNKNPSGFEDYLIINDWSFLGNEYIKKENSETKEIFEILKREYIKPGVKTKYRNNNNDSEIIIFQNSENKKYTITYKTVNNHNFNSLVEQLNKVKYFKKKGDITNDPEAILLYKKYIGELINIERNIGFYNKNKIFIKVYSYVKSPVIEVNEDKTELGGYNSYYDSKTKITLHKLEFEVQE